MILAGTPDISSSRFRSFHDLFCWVSRNPSHIEAAKLTRNGSRFTHALIPLQAIPTAGPLSLSTTPSFPHQFTKMPSAFFDDLHVRRLLLEQSGEVVVLETHEEEVEDDTDPSSSSSSSFSWGEQEGQDGREAATGPETKSGVKELQWEQMRRRRWRATRKLAWWTLASQVEQRNAASEGQKTAAAALQSSHLRIFIFSLDRSEKNE